MLIRVNETTWVRLKAIRRVIVARANIVGKSKPRFSVNIETDDSEDYNTYTMLFDTWDEAVVEANNIVDIVNRAELTP